MAYQKKPTPITDALFLLGLCSMMDFLMLGICGIRIVHWMRMAYILTILMGSAWWLVALAGLGSVIVGTLLHGLAIEELAITVVAGAFTLFVARRTAIHSFARSVVASGLIAFFMLAGAYVQTGLTWHFPMTGSTFFQIIANIIIINLLLKCTS